MWSQVGLRKHHYKQSYWRWWNSSWAIPNPKQWCCESAALNTSANLENSALATGLERVSFHSNPKEGKCQRMFKLPYNCAHASKVFLKILQARLQQYVNLELPHGQAGFRKDRGTRDQIANILWISKGIPEKYLLLLHWLCYSLCLCRLQQTMEKS